MRLVCPNCDAKYEVPEDAIPDTGRDVQCANCGHAWFQMRPVTSGPESPAPEAKPAVAAQAQAPVAEPALAPAVADPVPAAEEAAAPDAVADSAPRQTEPETEVAPASEQLAGAAGANAAMTASAAAAGASAYAVDDSVLAILREEAEREAKARRAEAVKPLETQPDLGIDAAVPARARPATAPISTEGEDERRASQRARLPDVEEIKSTLRPSEVTADDNLAQAAPPPAEVRSSFRSGFLWVITVAILASAVYGSADALSDAIPALAGPLKAYVGFVDSLRLQLDGLMQSATVAINGNEG